MEVLTCDRSPRIYVRSVWGDARPRADCVDFPDIQGVYILLRNQDRQGTISYAGPLSSEHGYSPTFPGPCRIVSHTEGNKLAQYVISDGTDTAQRNGLPGVMKSETTGGRQPYSCKVWKVANFAECTWVPTIHYPITKIDAKVRLHFSTSARPHLQGLYELVDYVNKQPVWTFRNVKISSRYARDPGNVSDDGSATGGMAYWIVTEVSGGVERKLVRSNVHDGRPPYAVKQWKVFVNDDLMVPCDVTIQPVETTSDNLGLALKTVSEQLDELQAVQSHNMNTSAPHTIYVTCEPASISRYEGLYTLAEDQHNTLPYWVCDKDGSVVRVYCGALGRWHIAEHVDSLQQGFAGVRTTEKHNGKLPHEITAWELPLRPAQNTESTAPEDITWQDNGVTIHITAKTNTQAPTPDTLQQQVHALQRELRCLKGAPQSMEILEHQRWTPGIGWGTPDLPGDCAGWVDADGGVEYNDLEDVAQPDQKVWLGLWQTDKSKGTRGWEYAVDFSVDGSPALYTSPRKAVDRVRRRMWLRHYGDGGESFTQDERTHEAVPAGAVAGDAACDDLEFVESDDDEPSTHSPAYEVEECYFEALSTPSATQPMRTRSSAKSFYYGSSKRLPTGSPSKPELARKQSNFGNTESPTLHLERLEDITLLQSVGNLDATYDAKASSQQSRSSKRERSPSFLQSIFGRKASNKRDPDFESSRRDAPRPPRLEEGHMEVPVMETTPATPLVEERVQAVPLGGEKLAVGVASSVEESEQRPRNNVSFFSQEVDTPSKKRGSHAFPTSPFQSQERKEAVLQLIESEIAALNEGGPDTIHTLNTVHAWLAVLEEPDEGLSTPHVEDDSCEKSDTDENDDCAKGAVLKLIETELGSLRAVDNKKSIERLRQWLQILENPRPENKRHSLASSSPVIMGRNTQFNDALTRLRHQIVDGCTPHTHSSREFIEKEPKEQSAAAALSWEILAAKRTAAVVTLAGLAAARAATAKRRNSCKPWALKKATAPLFTCHYTNRRKPGDSFVLDDSFNTVDTEQGLTPDLLMLDLPEREETPDERSPERHQEPPPRRHRRRSTADDRIHITVVLAASVLASVRLDVIQGAMLKGFYGENRPRGGVSLSPGRDTATHVLLAVSLVCVPQGKGVSSEMLVAALRGALCGYLGVDAKRLRGVKLVMDEGRATVECMLVDGGPEVLGMLQRIPQGWPLSTLASWAVSDISACQTSDLTTCCPSGHLLFPSVRSAVCRGRCQERKGHSGSAAFACQQCRYAVCKNCYASLRASQ